MFSYQQVAPHVWYIWDRHGRIVATLDDSGDDPEHRRPADVMQRQAQIMTAALNAKAE